MKRAFRAQSKRGRRGAQPLLANIERLRYEIAELERAQREWLQYRQDLEELVAMRTSELASAAQRERVADRAKRSFLSNMSHELRTPLAAIMGYGQILLHDEALTPHQQTGLKVIVSSGEHMLGLIQDLLDLSRIESGKLEIYPGEVELPAFLHGVADIIRLKAAHKGLQLVCEIDPELPCVVRLDAVRLRQVLLNLLGNAVKFTEHGHVTLRVRLSGAAPARLRFEVQDSGAGIAAQHLQAIFTPFAQLGAERQHSGGLGLGLAISSELVQSMGGRIHVDSALGQGSLFAFELDVQPGSAHSAPAPLSSATLSNTGEFADPGAQVRDYGEAMS